METVPRLLDPADCGAGVEFVVMEFWEPFFRGEYPEVDAFLMPVEQASAWSLLYPHYAVAVPQPHPVLVPTAFAVAVDATDLLRVIDEWVVFADHAGIIRQAYDYWILGQGAGGQQQRWSILHDVLGWGKSQAALQQ